MLKIAIIHGKNLMDGKDLEGKITHINSSTEQEQHIVSLMGFLQDHYQNDKNLQKLTYLYPIQTASYVFTRLGDIVFIDTTGADPKSSRGKGTFMMPDSITEKQKQGLIEFKEELKNYDDIRVDYDILYDMGIFDATTLSAHGEQASNVVETYLEKVSLKENDKTK